MSVDVSSMSIVQYPNPVLRRKAAEVAAINDEVRAVAARMIELMNEAEGVGLAAPQVGLSWRMFVTKPWKSEQGDESHPQRVFINPRLRVGRGELIAHDEGCLSLPGITIEVRRPRQASIEAFDERGRPFAVASEAFIARIWQHEFDHINGVLIIDRMSPKDRLATRRTLRDLELAAGS